MPSIVGTATSLVNTATSSSPETASYTAESGSNRIVWVAVYSENGATDGSQDVSAITWNSVSPDISLTGAATDPSNVTYLESCWLFGWKESNIPAGSQTVSVTMVNTGVDIIIYAFTQQDVDQTTSTGTPVTAWVDNTTAITQAFSTTASDSQVISLCIHSAASSGAWTPETSDGTNVELYDAQVGSSNLGFTATAVTLAPGSVDSWVAGSNTAANNGTNAGGVILSVEVFNAGGSPPASTLLLISQQG